VYGLVQKTIGNTTVYSTVLPDTHVTYDAGAGPRLANSASRELNFPEVRPGCLSPV